MRWFAFAAAWTWGMLPVVAQEPEPQPTPAYDIQPYAPGPVAAVPQPGPSDYEIAVPQPSLYADPSPALSVRVYSVADLVIQPAPAAPVPDAAEALRSESSPYPTVQRHATVSAHQRAVENLAELSVILQSVTTPESWDAAGGPGHITIHGNTFSLIVRQTQAMHEEIADLLAQLRRLHDLEVELTFEIFVPESDDAADDAEARIEQLLAKCQRPLAAEELAKVRQLLAGSEAPCTRPRALLPNGVATRGEIFDVTAVISPDRRWVQLHLEQYLALDETAPKPESFRVRIADGGSMLVSAAGGDLFALVTAKIVLHEEEEELLSIVLSPTRTISSQVGTVTPRIIIQEEEELREDAAADSTAAVQIPIVYAVADLLLCRKEQSSQPAGDAPGVATSLATAECWEAWLDSHQLTQLITSTVAPESWKNGGTIVTHPGTLSLVIRQTRPVHQKIANLLSVLRRVQSALHPQLAADAQASPIVQASAETLTDRAAPSPTAEDQSSDTEDGIAVFSGIPRLYRIVEQGESDGRIGVDFDFDVVGDGDGVITLTAGQRRERRRAHMEEEEEERKAEPAELNPRQHVLEAAEHLAAAGLPEFAEEVRTNGQRILTERLQAELGEVERAIAELQRKAAGVREQLEALRGE
jgi:hypothetical protein